MDAPKVAKPFKVGNNGRNYMQLPILKNCIVHEARRRQLTYSFCYGFGFLVLKNIRKHVKKVSKHLELIHANAYLYRVIKNKETQ